MVHSYGWKDGDTWALLRLRVQFLPSGVEDINSFVLLRNTSVFKLRKEIRMRKRRRKSQPAFPFHSFSLCPYLLSVFPFYSLWWTCAPWNAWEFPRIRDKKPFHFKIWSKDENSLRLFLKHWFVFTEKVESLFVQDRRGFWLTSGFFHFIFLSVFSSSFRGCRSIFE